MCCNAELLDEMHKAYDDLRNRPEWISCNIQAITNSVQVKFWSYYTIGRGSHPRENFPGNVGKNIGESEFYIFEAKKHFPDSGKACVLKRKVVKMRFLPKNDPF